MCCVLQNGVIFAVKSCKYVANISNFWGINTKTAVFSNIVLGAARLCISNLVLITQKCNYGKVFCILLHNTWNGVLGFGNHFCLEVSLFMRALLRDCHFSLRNKRALSETA